MPDILLVLYLKIHILSEFWCHLSLFLAKVYGAKITEGTENQEIHLLISLDHNLSLCLSPQAGKVLFSLDSLS